MAKKNRSDAYQHLILEICTAPETLVDYSDSRGMAGMINSARYNEELMDLKEQLTVAFWRIVDTELTERQSQVLRMTAQGKTQTDIAKKLNVNQSSITKSIHGNVDYSNGKRVYGGAKKKLMKLMSKDEEIQEILLKISEISQDD